MKVITFTVFAQYRHHLFMIYETMSYFLPFNNIELLETRKEKGFFLKSIRVTSGLCTIFIQNAAAIILNTYKGALYISLNGSFNIFIVVLGIEYQKRSITCKVRTVKKEVEQAT